MPSNEVPTTLAGIASLYPSLAEALREAAGRIEMSSQLESSPEYRELVYESSKLDITESLKACSH